jgi:hypothetical protein
MSTHDADVMGAVRESLDAVTMHTPVEQIVTAGRRRVRRRRVVRTATGIAAVTGLAFGVPALDHPSTAPPAVHIRTAGFTLDKNADGTVKVTWSKEQYFKDRDGLQKALRAAGFPVLIKEGVFCLGPGDDTYLDPAGTGRGVDRVRKAHREADDKVEFTFDPRAMPAGKQLFIGYLSPAQLAVTHGQPGSIERLVSTGASLTCTPRLPYTPPRPGGGDTGGGDKPRPGGGDKPTKKP